VQLNIGSRGSIEKIEDSEVPKPEDIPETTPKAETAPGQGRGGFRRSYGRRPGGGRRYRPSGEGEEGGEEEGEEGF